GPEAGGNPGRGGMPRGAFSMMMSPEGAHLKAPSATLSAIAEMISRFSERPVVDMTGIEGQYDVDLVFTPETLRNMPAVGAGPMPPAAAAEQLPGAPREPARFRRHAV